MFVEQIAKGAKGLVRNGNGTTNSVLKEGFGFIVAEGTSMLVGLGVFAATANIAPGIINGVSNALAKTVIEPFLDPIEHAMAKVCKLEECKTDLSVSREERSRNIARTLMLFGASGVAAYGSKIWTRRAMNHQFGIESDETNWWNILKLSRKEKIIFAADEGVHYGSMILLNTGAAGVTDDFIRTVQNVMEKCGMSKKKAHELAGYTMVWELPNFLGLIAGLSAIYATHKIPGPLGLPRH